MLEEVFFINLADNFFQFSVRVFYGAAFKNNSAYIKSELGFYDDKVPFADLDVIGLEVIDLSRTA